MSEWRSFASRLSFASLAISVELIRRESNKQSVLVKEMTLGVLDDKMLIFAITGHLLDLLGADVLQAKEMDEADEDADAESDAGKEKKGDKGKGKGKQEVTDYSSCPNRGYTYGSR